MMLTSMHFLHPKLVLIPALLTRRSTQETPKYDSQESNNLVNCSGLVTSHCTKVTFFSPNFSLSSFSVASPPSSLTSEMQTLAPAVRSLRAKALPSPWADPVTKHTESCTFIVATGWVTDGAR